MRRDPVCVAASTWTRNVDLIRLGITSDGTFWNNKPYRYPRHQIPIKGMSKDQLRFHRAWQTLKENLRELAWIHYVPNAGINHKFRAVNLLEDRYFQALEDAQARIEWEIVNSDR